MRAANIVDGKVVGYCVVESYYDNFIDPRNSTIGDLWDGSTFTKPSKSFSEIEYSLKQSVQNLLDSKAQEKQYDNIISACSYAGAANPFQVESIAFLSWRGAVWEKCYQLLKSVEDGISPIPSEADLLSSLPPLSLP